MNRGIDGLFQTWPASARVQSGHFRRPLFQDASRYSQISVEIEPALTDCSTQFDEGAAQEN